MKKLVLTCLTTLIMFLIKGQELSSQFIDSVAEKSNTPTYKLVIIKIFKHDPRNTG